MKSFNRIGIMPASMPLSADDILEFHIARILLLLKVCGTSGRIDSLTKMAKLDFFVRYPEFFEAARHSLTSSYLTTKLNSRDTDSAVESAMVRHHYGPWDKRYYHILSHLEAKRLITVSKEKNSFRIALTELGKDRTQLLQNKPSFAELIHRMSEVKKAFGPKSGNYLKELIYRLFDAEVGQRPMGEVIQK